MNLALFDGRSRGETNMDNQVERTWIPDDEKGYSRERLAILRDAASWEDELSSGRGCTDLNSVCYNSFTEHGQMFWLATSCGRPTNYRRRSDGS